MTNLKNKWSGWSWYSADFTSLESNIFCSYKKGPTDYAYISHGDTKINMLYIETLNKSNWFFYIDQGIFKLTLANYTRLMDNADRGLISCRSMRYSEMISLQEKYGRGYYIKASMEDVKWYEPLEVVGLVNEFPRPYEVFDDS